MKSHNIDRAITPWMVLRRSDHKRVYDLIAASPKRGIRPQEIIMDTRIAQVKVYTIVSDLYHAGLVDRRRSGRGTYYTPNKALSEMMQEFASEYDNVLTNG